MHLMTSETFRKQYSEIMRDIQGELSLLMHHDTITGTSQQKVVEHEKN